MWLKQQWRLVVDTIDLISFETISSDLTVRIEARKKEDHTWSIFKTYSDHTFTAYTEEYHAKTRDEAQRIITFLQKEKLLTRKEIHERSLQRAKKVRLSLKRQFKDYNVEKWQFAVNADSYENLIYIRDADVIEVNVLMAEKYRLLEKQILAELQTILGLDVAEFDIKQEVYYYTTHSEKYFPAKNPAGLFLGKMEMGFDFSDEEK